jgi:hypothetical protein
VGDVNLAENSALPSDMNNAVREVMSHQKEAFGSGTPLYVDQTNNKVGIGTTSPTYQATVFGSSQSTVEIESGSDTGESRLYFTDPTTTGVGTVEYHHNGNTMRFQVNSAERMRLTADGLTFNGDTAAANALDDYEEGTFIVTDGSGAGLTLTQNVTARYVKVGRLVFVNLYVTYPSTTASETATLGGFPFGGSTDTYSFLCGRTLNHGVNDMVWQLNNTLARIHYNNSGRSNSDLSNAYVLVSGCYYTDS